MSPRRAVLLGAAVWAALPMRVQAQARWQREAVPLYTPRDFVSGYLRAHAVPRASAWMQACAQLVQILAGPQDTPADARQAWQQVDITWSSLAAVATGPLVTRRTARRVDFHPVRVPSLLRALAHAPSGEAAMEQVGSAAKGLAALEWLLWAPAAPHDGAARAYAQEVARDVLREAEGVMADFTMVSQRTQDDEELARWFEEIVNQWISALEHLRLQRLLRPVAEAMSRGQQAPLLERPFARTDAAERQARWQAIQSLACSEDGAAPAQGQGQLVPIETYLRGRGLNPLADRLHGAIQAAQAALRSAATGTAPSLRGAARLMGAAKTLAEADVAPALNVRVGFSDADGD